TGVLNPTGISAGSIQNDAGCPNVNADAVTGACWDVLGTLNLPAGSYTVVLSQNDNTPLGGTFGDGFFRTGQGNYTETAFGPGVGSGPFWDANPNQRNGSWALDILNVNSAADLTVPEPATGPLVLCLAITLLAARRRAT